SPVLSNKTIDEEERLQHYITIADEENPDGPFQVSMLSNSSRINLTKVTNSTYKLQILNNITAQFIDVGTWQVNITACDPNSSCVNGTLYITVDTINHAPVFANVSQVSA